MTLILTEISCHGIAMAADSAVTESHIATGAAVATPNAARKLQPVPHLRAGLSCWGMGELEDTPTDQWLEEFIRASTRLSSLQAFASALANKLNLVLPPYSSPSRGPIGIHLCGFELLDGNPTPSFFHIHDGQSQELAKRGVAIDPFKVNPNHDVPPERARDILAKNGIYITRNGDYRYYVKMFHQLALFFRSLEPEGVIIPWTNNLLDRVDYLVFQIRVVSEVYRLSNLVPGIGGGVHYLTITPDGIKDQGVRYF